MNISYGFNYRGPHLEHILEQCNICKNLYNQALYVVRQELETNKRWIFYPELDKIMKEIPNLEGTINYKLLKSVNAQQCLRQLDKNLLSYIKAIKDWSKDRSKYKGMPQLPSYKKKYNQLIYSKIGCSIRNGYLKLDKKTAIKIPQYDKYKVNLDNFKCVKILPKDTYIRIKIIYDVKCLDTIKNRNYASIDLGINNLMTVITNTGKAVIYNGRQLKSKNQFFNKRLSNLKSKLKTNNNKNVSKQTIKITEKRNNQIKDLIHKSTTHLVNLLKQENISMVAIGHNNGWKSNSTLSQRTAQAFQYIPFTFLINVLRYKLKLAGIKLIENEESYTSKCDALAFETVSKHDTYKGKRIKRGLYQSSVGKLINADINGAINILRKVTGDDSLVDVPTDRGLWFNPILYHNLYKLG